MEIIEINRVFDDKSDHFGSVRLDRDEIIMISNAIEKYYQTTENEDEKINYSAFIDEWRTFRMVACYG